MNDNQPTYIVKATQQKTNQVRYLDQHNLLVRKPLAQPYDWVEAKRIADQLLFANTYPTHDLAIEEVQ